MIYRTTHYFFGSVFASIVSLWALSLAAAAIVMLSGCAGLADLTASTVAPAFDPESIVLEQDHAAITFSVCESMTCFDLLLEFTRFEITLDGGEVISCLGVYIQPTWVDGTRNEWLSASSRSDPRCEGEMERLAEHD